MSFYLEGDWVNVKVEYLEGEVGIKGVWKLLKIWEGFLVFFFLRWRKVICKFGNLKIFKVRLRVEIFYLLLICLRFLLGELDWLLRGLNFRFIFFINLLGDVG